MQHRLQVLDFYLQCRKKYNQNDGWLVALLLFSINTIIFSMVTFKKVSFQ